MQLRAKTMAGVPGGLPLTLMRRRALLVVAIASIRLVTGLLAMLGQELTDRWWVTVCLEVILTVVFVVSMLTLVRACSRRL